MSETEQAAEAVEEEGATATATAEPPVEAEAAPEAEVAVEPEAEAEAAAEPEAEAEAQSEPVAVTEEEPAQEAVPAPAGPAAGRQAKVFLCDRGHRTVSLWSQPTSCHARPTRNGAECGRQLYPIGELPEQVQKALNPLKASKKASKG